MNVASVTLYVASVTLTVSSLIACHKLIFKNSVSQPKNALSGGDGVEELSELLTEFYTVCSVRDRV